ncbi:hypothetical protein P153DRAFT_153111 [Dothidotthia symphoricarpi CBS 119687]|uniref:Uncharacterized protein n=1 Tax=Dothidotthia symphoricarpi CBS 119687 TaxID=1392245 RepID=A0A6A6AQL8_9PLEO|nr:uncharacterized protein P153DRAFT_153111 [Dothidotthia symphoricarpi CBS 119687]KAF2133254.1 hypothetical protein P153DRAFT_153111 [Dothidotthia symphoricarpi CBS 119687]
MHTVVVAGSVELRSVSTVIRSLYVPLTLSNEQLSLPWYVLSTSFIPRNDATIILHANAEGLALMLTTITLFIFLLIAFTTLLLLQTLAGLY